MLLTIFR